MLGSGEGYVGVRVSERVNMSLNIARTQRSVQNTGSKTCVRNFRVCDQNTLNHKTLIFLVIFSCGNYGRLKLGMKSRCLLVLLFIERD